MKVRYLEHRPDEWLIGVAGMTPEQNGIYRTICDLIASSGGPIPIDDERLFSIVKAKQNRIKRVITELLERNKLSVTGSQLSNNRVITELERARNRSTRGSELASKRWENNDLGDAGGTARARKLETKNEKLINENRKDANRASSNEGFDHFWKCYPDKVAKGAARTAFSKAIRKTSLDQLIAGVERYKASKPVDRAWCNPATWLNGERWLDVPATNGADHHNISFRAPPTEPAPTLEELGIQMDRPH